METTLNLDEDVAAALQERAELVGITFEQAANDVLSVWLDLTVPLRRPPERNGTYAGGYQPGVNSRKLSQIDTELMNEEYLAKKARDR